jgi:hypothetical protein
MRFATAVCLAFLLAALASALAAAPPASSRALGLKVTTREIRSASGRPGTNAEVQTRYIRADRSRFEWEHRNVGSGGVEEAALHSVTITRCDLRRSFILDMAKRQYDWMPLRPLPTRAQGQAYAAWWGMKPEPPRKPTVLIEITTSDTGERQAMFGRTARHVVFTRKQIPLVAGENESSEVVTDGWYIDLDTAVSCERSPGTGRGYAFLTAGGKDTSFTFRYVGRPETGFLVGAHTTSRSTQVAPDGSRTDSESLSETVVTEFTQEALPDALFEIPPGFRERPVSLWELSNRYWDLFKAGAWRLLYR